MVMTKNRRAILQLLQNAKQPLNATQLYHQSAKAFDLATVYRALSYLEKHELVDSFLLTCSCCNAQRYYTAAFEEQHHYFHCHNCHCFIDVSTALTEDLLERYRESYGVAISDYVLTLGGLCPQCQTTSQR